MSSVTTNDFKNGMKIMLDGAPCTVIDTDFVKPGKGQAFCRAKLRNLMTSRVLEKTFKSGEMFELADVADCNMKYLYPEGDTLHFMAEESFEQYVIQGEVVAEAKKWIQEQDVCIVTLWNDRPICVTPPNFVILKIVETDPGLKGDTSGGGSKQAVLETGAVVRVPLFVQQGVAIKVDTRTGEYVSRA